MLRRNLVLDLSTAFDALVDQASVLPSATSGGTVSDYDLNPTYRMPTTTSTNTLLPFLAGFHLPRVRERDTYYTRLEQERAEARE
ncbi:cytochrome c oxidase family protein [Penicillium waksmanii]|uniref:cytochrome c oxidase family protein n=1 Tax=Penicillium waksmanii TaxID=69791 RepID=UPI002548F8AE|nr:cytochrome c oxidase family protein [Penicillium waksmanii]KAJ5965274.1 cytochrome c oxidase family protein [Penicillium waksmanii]